MPTIFRILSFSISFLITVAATGAPVQLSLHDAILLALRDNPNVEISQLSLLQQKFATEVERWQFQPHFAFNVNSTISQSMVDGYRQTNKITQVQPSVSWLSPIGTRVNVNPSNNALNHFRPTLSVEIVQPLLRGFGKPIVEAALFNAIDSEKVSRLNVVSTLQTTITGVITAYLNVLSAQETVKVDKIALQRAQQTVDQTKIFIKAGHKAGNELITVQADVANSETTLENDKNNLKQAHFALLTSIGIDPNTEITITDLNVDALIRKFKIPKLEETKIQAVENDIQYQTDFITVSGAAKRNLQVAEDNAKWKLDLNLNAGSGEVQGTGSNAALSDVFNGFNNSKSASLNLSIPIDDRLAKQSILSAKIALREATLSLKQEKWNKETDAINGWNTVFSAKRAYDFALRAALYQQKNYQINYQKYLYGLIDSIELQSVRAQLIVNEQMKIASQLNYLISLVNLDRMLGSTLNTWDVHVRFE